MTTPHEYAQQHGSRFVAELYELLRMPSVSTDPRFAADCRRTAEWLRDHLRGIGLQSELIEKAGQQPIVYAEWLQAGADKPTVLIYGHYDVQPAVKSDGWESEPFEPVEKDGFIYARGASDDKGQVYTHVKALEAILKTDGKLPVNVKFIIEGEEESSGKHVGEFVRGNVAKLKADVCVISDGGMAVIEQPVISNALRGAIAMEVTVYGPKQDLHSGMYGGTVHNPTQALAEIIAKLHHPDGSVAIPGFYDAVRGLTPSERAEIAAVEMTAAQWADETGAPQPWGEAAFSLSERIGARPTLEITGMAGGYYDKGYKNIVAEKAWAKISCRLVADQNPAHIGALVQAYIEQITPPTVRVDIRYDGGIGAALIPTDNRMMQAAISAYQKAWGASPVFKREGGSIPIVSDFQGSLQLPVILMGFGLNSDGLHGPNEHYSVAMFHKGIATSIQFLYEVAAL
jgi:acetylornithine deacetylase/succinyl-diaminopimelate desuccinylase-like protein